MLQTVWHHVWAPFSLFFQMVCSILLAVLPSKTPTADWWKSFHSQSGCTKRMVLKCNTESKTEYTIGKSNENWTENWCQIVCSILFDLFDCMTSSAEALNALFHRFSVYFAWKWSFPGRSRNAMWRKRGKDSLPILPFLPCLLRSSSHFYGTGNENGGVNKISR